jgi:hypothetical protein
MKIHSTKILLSLAAGILCAANLHAADLKLNERDINKVELELKPKSPVTTLRIHFSNFAAMRFQEVVNQNLNQPISLFMDDRLVATISYKDPLSSNNRFLSIPFPKFDSAASAAKVFASGR